MLMYVTNQVWWERDNGLLNKHPSDQLFKTPHTLNTEYFAFLLILFWQIWLARLLTCLYRFAAPSQYYQICNFSQMLPFEGPQGWLYTGNNH